MIRPSGKSLTDQITDEMRAAMTVMQVLEKGPSRAVPANPQQRPPPSMIPRPGGGKYDQPAQPGRPQNPTGAPDGPMQFPPRRQEAPSGFVSRQVIGRRYQFAQDDPIVTGEMIPVTSSNVHSIGYEWNEAQPINGTLKVRFLEHYGKGMGTGPGALYDYFNVHPEVFIAFQLAASKGKFVWDRLRIRGTVTGHRFHYELEGLGASGTVPRKATRLGPNEYYLKRQFTDQAGRTSTSHLQDEFVQRIGNRRHGPQGMVPGRGTPNRGRP